MPFQPGNKCAAGRRSAKKVEYKQALADQVPGMIQILVDIAKNAKKDKDRIVAATAIIDRCYGRPGQAIRVDHTAPIDQSAVMAALADQARGVIIDADEDGVQRLVVSPRMLSAENRETLDITSSASDY